MDPKTAAVLGIAMRADGTFERLPTKPCCEASPEAFHDGVASKDIFLGKEAGDGERLRARIFLPQPHTHSINLRSINSSSHNDNDDDKVRDKLPLVLYFHGGGFVFHTVDDLDFHPFLHRLAKTAHAIVVALDYRLAPEHRLPAAFNDCLAAVNWLHSQASDHAQHADPWLRMLADFSRCYLIGDSAGGNIVHNLSLKLSGADMDPLHIRGHVLIHPFFGGVARTRTEELMANDSTLSLNSTDWMWGLALPEGADRDHPACNPMTIPSSVYANVCIPKTLIAIAHGDLMKERQTQYFTTLKEAGVDIHLHMQDGGHAFYVDGSENAACFINNLAMFLRHC